MAAQNTQKTTLSIEQKLKVLEYAKEKVLSTKTPGGGALECNLTGRCPFFKSLHNPFGKKNCILIPFFGIFRLENNGKQWGKQ